VGFFWFVPLVGAVMYFIFGVNRIRHTAALLRRNLERYRAQATQPECPPEEVFTDDWLFTTGEALRGDSWFPKTESAGQVLARGVTDGPDENFEKLL
jgi:hypothetical protein